MNTPYRAAGANGSAAAAKRLAALSVALAAGLSISQQAAAQAPTYQITFTNLTSNALTAGAPPAQTGQRLPPASK